MNKLSLVGLCLASALGLAACASAQASPEPAPAAQKTSADDQTSVCVANMTKARECTDVYIPALVDARAQANVPPGIADSVKQDRDSVIKQAMEEWKVDSQDANIADRCGQMAAHVQVTQDDLAAVKDCNAKSECQEFTSCSMPVLAKYFHK